jgi:hypothetical protein
MTVTSWNYQMRVQSLIACLAVILVGSLAAAEPALRTMKYATRPKEEAAVWQQEVRTKLFQLLKLEDLLASRGSIALNPATLSSESKDGCRLQEIEINSTPGRRFKAIVTLPTGTSGPRPAVVCIHGHGGNRRIVHDTNSLYRGFAAALAERGYVTISTDVGQHTVYEQDRSLMGERLWDLMRCVDYLESLPQVDKTRIGCGGLSLGGEMAMWLGAMDTRMTATVSSGFLTKMDQMEQNHCLCWKFDGLRELVDFADIYSLTAPRALLCQNGLQEPASQFPVPLACEALKEISVIYGDFGQPQNAAVLAHTEGHIVHLPSMVAFFDEHLGYASGASSSLAP